MKIYYENAAQGYFGDVKTNKESVSIGVFEQVKWERDVAIEQLKELGYGLGEKIRTDEDAISRQAVLDKAVYTETEEGWSGRTVDVKVIEALPSVKPKERTGHWIAVYQGDEIINYRCSECEFGNTFGKNTDGMYYCPNCGAKMKE